MSEMRQRILLEATHLFARRGYEGTSVQAISEAVGIRKPSLLYHFPSKALLRDAVLESLLSRWGSVVPRVMTAATTGENRFESTLTEVIGFFEADPDRARLLWREMLDRPDELRVLLSAHLSPWIGLVSSTIRRGQRDGIIYADLDPETWIFWVITMAVGGFSAAGLSGVLTEDTPKRRRTELVRIARVSLFIHTSEGSLSNG
ncbi:MAG: TetR/AcrR family transcriptional regulator [Myxococcota bacterium]|jgi:TetR/AcrR family transcriptional regulator